MSIEVDKVVKEYGTQKALNEVSFKIDFMIKKDFTHRGVGNAIVYCCRLIGKISETG